MFLIFSPNANLSKLTFKEKKQFPDKTKLSVFKSQPTQHGIILSSNKYIFCKKDHILLY